LRKRKALEVRNRLYNSTVEDSIYLLKGQIKETRNERKKHSHDDVAD